VPPRGKQPASTSGHRFWVLIGHNLATPQIVIFRVLGDSGARMCTHRVNQQDYHAPVPWETTFRRQRPHYTGLWLSVPSRADAFRYIAFCLANYPALHGLRESGFRPEDAPIYDSLADVPHLIPLLVLQPDYQPRRWWANAVAKPLVPARRRRRYVNDGRLKSTTYTRRTPTRTPRQ